MSKSRQNRQHLLCVKNEGYPASLEVRKIYRALAADAEPARPADVTDSGGDGACDRCHRGGALS
jgi:hypothetical protein